jgi:hypothetical protein
MKTIQEEVKQLDGVKKRDKYTIGALNVGILISFTQKDIVINVIVKNLDIQRNGIIIREKKRG